MSLHWIQLAAVLMLGLLGCNEMAGSGGSGAAGGSEAAGGSGASAGDGGSAGMGGGGGVGGSGGARACVQWEEGDPLCLNGGIAPFDPIEPCCELPSPPDQPSACDGRESTENPTSCTAAGATSTYVLTQFELLQDCNFGYDLDGCFGRTCMLGGLAAGDGAGGVDNGLAGLARVFSGVGGNLGGLNQTFADSLCGKTDRRRDIEGCESEIPRFDLSFQVDADVDDGCAQVTMRSGATELGSVAMNLSDEGCLSGVLPNIPFAFENLPGEFSNVTLRTTIGPAGFSNGVMGATAGESFGGVVADLLVGDVTIRQLFDINADLSVDAESPCDAMSATFKVGGALQQ